MGKLWSFFKNNLLKIGISFLLVFIAWFGVLLIVIARSYGLYDPILNRSGLHEQRLTVQAALTSGLLLCGTLYLARAEMVSRIVVVLTVIFTMVLLCSRRAICRNTPTARAGRPPVKCLRATPRENATVNPAAVMRWASDSAVNRCRCCMR